MKYSIIYFLLGLILFSCGKKTDDGAASMSLEQRDSLLITYITKEFYYDNPSTLRDFKKQLKHLRTTSESDYTHEAYFKNYHFKSFLFDALSSASPFVVEITNNNDQFVSFFSFTDEDYYRGNSINSRGWITHSVQRDSILQQRINLEDNLNQLVGNLGISKRHEMLDFTKVICSLLNMKEISEDSIRNEIKWFYFDSEQSLNDSISNLVEKEQALFFQKGSGDILQIRTQDRLGLGYWRFWIERNKDGLIIRTAFFSDILFQPMYM